MTRVYISNDVTQWRAGGGPRPGDLASRRRMSDLHLSTDHNAFATLQALLLGFLQYLLHTVGVTGNASPGPTGDRVRHRRRTLECIARGAQTAHFDVVSES